MKTAEELRNIQAVRNVDSLLNNIGRQLEFEAKEGFKKTEYLTDHSYSEDVVISAVEKLQTNYGYNVEVREATAFPFKLIISW